MQRQVTPEGALAAALLVKQIDYILAFVRLF